MSTYNELFYNYINIGAKRSAQELLPHLIKGLPIKSVLDVGCGQGAWLSVYSQHGIKRVFGIDGDYVDLDRLLIDKSSFAAFNLEQDFDLNARFDLVQSLEVAEHLSPTSADQFVLNLVKHGDIVLFSAAPKGQGGDHHVNEQSYDYWREKFSNHGYELYDCVRPLLKSNSLVEPWYRYNIFLYISASSSLDLPDWILETKVPHCATVEDISPIWYKARKGLIRTIPYSMKNKLAKLKARFKATK